MNFLDWLDITDGHITEGYESTFPVIPSYSNNMHTAVYERFGHGLTEVVYDTKTYEIYEMDAIDFLRPNQYKFVNPIYIDIYNDYANIEKQWSEMPSKHILLETFEDFAEKARAILNGKEYDTRVSLPLELEDSELFALMKMAHEKDITLNQLLEQVVVEACDNAFRNNSPRSSIDEWMI